MATQIINYQCPSCTGPLHFAGDSGRLECEFCGSAFSVEEIEAVYAANAKESTDVEAQTDAAVESPCGDGWDASGLNEWGEEANDMKSYNCPSCGAELICDKTTAATTCPYCGNPNIVPGQFSGALKPDFVIPFKLEKDAAVAALKKFYKGKFFLPRVFASQNQIKKIQGVYVPFWLFDGSAEGCVTYNASRSTTRLSGDYEITETDHFVVERQGTISFEKVPVDASSKMPDDYMDAIEPYDYEGLKAFSNAYLPGYLADKYDVSIEDSQERADKRCSQTLKDSLRASVFGYSIVTERSSDIALQRGKVHYALLPVWLLNTKWKDKDYLFAVNGQTGKIVGDLPVDKGKYWGLFAGLSVGFTIISAILINLFA